MKYALHSFGEDEHFCSIFQRTRRKILALVGMRLFDVTVFAASIYVKHENNLYDQKVIILLPLPYTANKSLIS